MNVLISPTLRFGSTYLIATPKRLRGWRYSYALANDSRLGIKLLVLSGNATQILATVGERLGLKVCRLWLNRTYQL
ncbi:hypothetical protein V2G26_015798 [Clonostachys chloroleuca]